MNISIINIKEIEKKFSTIVFIVLLSIGIKVVLGKISLLEKFFSFENCSFLYTCLFSNVNNELKTDRSFNIIKYNFPILATLDGKELKENKQDDKVKDVDYDEEIILNPSSIVNVSERNIEESYNFAYESVKIKNQSKYDLSEIIINPNDIKLSNKKVIIYHTHTCESYTPSDKYNYLMTGNYRTTDNSFNVVRVGEELKKFLNNMGFTVIHDTSYHDFPSYNGSYDRSYDTVKNIIDKESDVSLIIDIHRDAVGDGSWYGPTISIDGKSVAQMMFVARNRWRGIRLS